MQPRRFCCIYGITSGWKTSLTYLWTLTLPLRIPGLEVTKYCLCQLKIFLVAFLIVKLIKITKLSILLKTITHFQRARAKRGFCIVVLVRFHGTMTSIYLIVEQCFTRINKIQIHFG